MNEHPSPIQVAKAMMKKDNFSQWLCIEIISISEGNSKLRMTVREEMINGFGIAHGGIAFALADSAFAFACNNRNNLSVALDATISFTRAVNVGDVLTAEAKEQHNGKSTGLYLVTVMNQRNEQIALFKGTCFRMGKPLV